MSSLFGIEASRAAQYLIAFAIILVLVALFGVVLRKLTGARLMVPGQDRGRSRQPRLGIVDIYDLDRQRQLVLLRRDNVEHLLLIGGLNDVVIETNIVRVAGARLSANEGGPVERFEPTLDQAPRPPQVEPAGRPSIETQIAAQLGSFVRRPSEESDAEQELAPVAEIRAPMPAHPEPVLKPNAVTVTAAPSVQGLRAEARNPASPSAPSAAAEPVVRPEPRPTFVPPPFQSRPTPTPPAPPSPPAPPVAPPQAPVAPPMAPPQADAARPPQPAPSPVAPVERPVQAERPAPTSAPEPAVLSDMAKQLEEALKRPAAPVPPPAAMAGPAPTPLRPARDDLEEDDDLLEPVQTVNEDEDRPKPVEEPKASPQPEPPRPAVEPVRLQPAPAAERAAEPAAPGAAQPSQKASDPFSVEDIEAEFARLLGRPLDSGRKG